MSIVPVSPLATLCPSRMLALYEAGPYPSFISACRVSGDLWELLQSWGQSQAARRLEAGRHGPGLSWTQGSKNAGLSCLYFHYLGWKDHSISDSIAELLGFPCYGYQNVFSIPVSGSGTTAAVLSWWGKNSSRKISSALLTTHKAERT